MTRTPPTRARRGAVALGGAFGLAVLTLAATPASAQDEGSAGNGDELAALLPADIDQLDDDQVGSLIEQMITTVGDSAATGDGSSSLTGPCGGFAFSFDEDGNLLDVAYDAGDDLPPQDLLGGGQAFTSGNPFVIDTAGTITYLGFAPQSGAGPMDHEYSIDVGGVNVADGGDPNTTGKNRNAGTIDMDEEMPFPISLKVSGNGSFTAPDFAGCAGSGHVEINGPGLFGPIGLAGLGLSAIGLAGLFFARPARTWRA